jgi:hypothetical protein
VAGAGEVLGVLLDGGRKKRYTWRGAHDIRADTMPFATSTCTVLDASRTQCVFTNAGTSSPPVYVGTVSGGEVLQISFLMLIFVALLVRFFKS